MSGAVLPSKEGLMKWVDEVADTLDLDCREALILTKFAAFADAAMETWAAVRTLARQGRSSERKVQYVLRKFEAEGLIRRTGRMHRLPDTTRDVPIYAFVGYLETLGEAAGRAADRAVPMGARRAPMAGDGCTEGPGMGAHTVHPHNEPIEPTPSDEGDAGAPARDARDLEVERGALFERLEAAYPKRGLGFTHRNRARGEFWRFVDGGGDAEALIRAAAAYAADKTVKRTDLGLDHWLADAKYRGWWPEAQLPLGEAKNGAVAAGPVDPAWASTLERLRVELPEVKFVNVQRSALREAGGQTLVVAPTSWARDQIRDGCWRKVQAAWADNDPQRRPIDLVSKLDFEALAMRAGQGVDGA